MAQMVKNPPAVQETRVQSLGRWGRFPGGGMATPLQYSCLENPTDRGAWWAAVHGVTESRTQLSDYQFHFHCVCVSLHVNMCECLCEWVYLCTCLCEHGCECVSVYGWICLCVCE